ncbi:MAG: DUF3047 domain-containing protein [Gemmatimonadota bacterium]|nr:DUF3047 domain-containing protein [Gemmatimonadota bacterium]
MLLLLVACCLTNLADVAPGPGLPDGWDLRRVRGRPAPTYAVTEEAALRVTGAGAVGYAVFELPDRLPPEDGVLTWRWRTATPLPDADLRDRRRDDSPVRVLVVFRDRRTLFYTWGRAERPGEWFASWTGSTRMVWVLRDVTDADGGWCEERRNPFTDYRTAFDRDPPAIVAVGIVQDSDNLGHPASAEVADLSWTPVAR